jgi:hypothetical protein
MFYIVRFPDLLYQRLQGPALHYSVEDAMRSVLFDNILPQPLSPQRQPCPFLKR